MLQIRIAIIFILLASAGGGYWYVQKLQKDNAILKANQIKLETAVADNNAVIEQQTKDLKKIRTTLKEVEETNAKLQADRDALNNRLGKHDIGNLAESKPGLVEKIINKAGAWFSYGDSKIGQGRENSKVYLEQNPELANEVKHKLLLKRGLITDGSTPKEETPDIDEETGEIIEPAKKKRGKKLQ